MVRGRKGGERRTIYEEVVILLFDVAARRTALEVVVIVILVVKGLLVDAVTIPTGPSMRIAMSSQLDGMRMEFSWPSTSTSPSLSIHIYIWLLKKAGKCVVVVVESRYGSRSAGKCCKSDGLLLDISIWYIQFSI